MPKKEFFILPVNFPKRKLLFYLSNFCSTFWLPRRTPKKEIFVAYIINPQYRHLPNLAILMAQYTGTTLQNVGQRPAENSLKTPGEGFKHQNVEKNRSNSSFK